MSRKNLRQLCFVAGLAGIFLILSGRSAQAESQQVSSHLPSHVMGAPPTSELVAAPLELEPEPATVMGTVETTAASLQTQAFTAQAVSPVPETTAAPVVAQGITLGRATRSGASYIAVGGNIGFGGSTGVGRGNFAVTSKVGLTNTFSLRPGVLIGNRSTFLIPATIDFPIAPVLDEGRVELAPFVGGGVAISTGEDSQVGPMITAGVDVPIVDQFTAVASTNLGFFDEAEVGLILGIGYNF